MRAQTNTNHKLNGSDRENRAKSPGNFASEWLRARRWQQLAAATALTVMAGTALVDPASTPDSAAQPVCKADLLDDLLDVIDDVIDTLDGEDEDREEEENP